MENTASTHFSYGITTRIGFPLGMFIALIWPFILFAIFGTSHLHSFPNGFSSGAIWGVVFLIAVWMLGLFAQVTSVVYKPSLDLDQNSITASILGMRWRVFKWNQIERIEKSRLYVGGQFGNMEFFDIISCSKRIRFYKSIHGFDNLVKLINEPIIRFSIPVFFQDRGSDTIQAVKAVTDRKEWRRVNRDGVRTKIAQL